MKNKIWYILKIFFTCLVLKSCKNSHRNFELSSVVLLDLIRVCENIKHCCLLYCQYLRLKYYAFLNSKENTLWLKVFQICYFSFNTHFQMCKLPFFLSLYSCVSFETFLNKQGHFLEPCRKNHFFNLLAVALILYSYTMIVNLILNFIK